jgi:acetyltransferase
MVTKEDLVYRQIFTLKDGARVLLRPLVPEDKQALLDLFLPVSPDDLRYMRHNVTDSKVVSAWADAIDYDVVFPLVAVVNNRIVGSSTLHFGMGPARHRAELRIFLAKDFRRRGVGSRMLQAVTEIAKRRSLYMLDVYVVSDQTHIIKAFQNAGFEICYTYEDYFMLPDGDLRDVTHLILHLRTTDDQF